jgi:hypothetical protein
MKYTMKGFLARVFEPSIIILLFTVSIWTLHHALDGYRNHDIVDRYSFEVGCWIFRLQVSH